MVGRFAPMIPLALITRLRVWRSGRRATPPAGPDTGLITDRLCRRYPPLRYGDGVGHRAAAWRVAFAFFVTMLGTTLPTPLYPLYQDRFRFTDLTVTGLYALYAVG